MSNSFNISVKPEIAAVKVDTADIRSDVTAIHDTALPAIDVLIDTIDTEVDAIRAADLPALDALIDTNLSAINSIPIRGETQFYYWGGTNDYFTDVVNVAGTGKLIQIQLYVQIDGDGIDLQLTIDGNSYLTALATNLNLLFANSPANVMLEQDMTGATIDNLNFRGIKAVPSVSDGSFNQLGIEFNSTLRVEVRRNPATAGFVSCKTHYILD